VPRATPFRARQRGPYNRWLYRVNGQRSGLSCPVQLLLPESRDRLPCPEAAASPERRQPHTRGGAAQRFADLSQAEPTQPVGCQLVGPRRSRAYQRTVEAAKPSS